jgi:hypothetical protein
MGILQCANEPRHRVLAIAEIVLGTIDHPRLLERQLRYAAR